MRLRTKYILFVSILHAVALVLSYLIFSEHTLFFILSEVVIIVSMVIAWQLYLQLIRPLQTLVRGADAIRDRDFNVKFLLTGKYELDQLIRVYNEMMDHLREERTRQEEQHFFLEKLIQTSPTGILVLDLDERVYQANPKALQVLGLEASSIIGQALSKLGSDEQAMGSEDHVMGSNEHAMGSNEDVNPGQAGSLVCHPLIREMVKLKTGESGVVAMNGIETYKLQKSHFMDRGFVRYFIMMEEVTAEILAAEKRAYGKVIRMMAHEVNNTVGPVNSILESALQSQAGGGSREGGADEGSAADGGLGNALRVAIQRNTNLNYFMRNFADVVRLPHPDKRPVDLLRLLEDVVALMRVRVGEKSVEGNRGEGKLEEGKSVEEWSVEGKSEEGKLEEEKRVERMLEEGKSVDGKRVEIFLEAKEEVWMVMADAQQLEQVFINILKNARESIGEEGMITVVAEPRTGRLVIRDTGAGIAPGLEEQLFSPFFSTKKNGQGIGLTLIREILINHGWGFSLKTLRPGVTEFEIRVGE